MRISDWSSDVCSSDLLGHVARLLLFDKRGGGEILAVFRQREFGLFLPAVLQAFELGDVAAHLLLVRDRAGGGGADFDERCVHLEGDLADSLFRFLRRGEQVGYGGGGYGGGSREYNPL